LNLQSRYLLNKNQFNAPKKPCLIETPIAGTPDNGSDFYNTPLAAGTPEISCSEGWWIRFNPGIILLGLEEVEGSASLFPVFKLVVPISGVPAAKGVL
jgi:hypothetical protein